jgi:large subunit ribosomal protein L13
LGRLATHVATLLMGKHKAVYSPHMDSGDFVNIKNPVGIIVTGKKESQKVYYRHSGYPSGLKKTSFKKLKKENPTKIIKLAVERMLPDNRLRDIRMTRLKFN